MTEAIDRTDTAGNPPPSPPSTTTPATPSAQDAWYLVLGPWYCTPQSPPAGSPGI